MFKILKFVLGAAIFAITTSLSVFALAQSITTVKAKFDAWSPGDSEKMAGRIKVNVLSFSGVVTGRTTKGVKCKGTVTLNILFDGGTGQMRCNDGRTGKFTYTLTSSLPPRGTGKGKMSNGKVVNFRITPG